MLLQKSTNLLTVVLLCTSAYFVTFRIGSCLCPSPSHFNLKNPTPSNDTLPSKNLGTTPTLKGSAMGNRSSDSTGKLFSGQPIRAYDGKRRYDQPSPTKQQQSLFAFHERNCTHWAVVTTIFAPSEAVQEVATNLTGWCMVVVGDTKTPNNYADIAGWTAGNGRNDIVYLSVDQQNQMMRHPLVGMTPVRSFARKNLGFLFAILHGARIVFDFDDDNVLTRDDRIVTGPSSIRNFSRLDEDDPVVFSRTVKLSDSYNKVAFNPFPLMKPSRNTTWPRGFPVNSAQNEMASGMVDATISGARVRLSSIGVVQSVCDGDPDVDAVYRMSHKLPVYFDSGHTASPLLVPHKSYAPYNAQATIHRYNALWGLYLPWTVTGRVSDIWRSYFTQRIMKDIGLELVYSPPFVVHHRNDHDYLADLEAESHLYLRTCKLLEFLSKWNDDSPYLVARIERLWIDLYERDYIGMNDVVGVQEWLDALEQAGYNFPAIPESNRNV